MIRRDFLKALGGAAAALLSGGAVESLPQEDVAQKRPNILWLISEDTSPDFACYGNVSVKTPNLDKLAADGARSTNAFAASPVCSASRSAIMTGMYQTSIGAHHHRSHGIDGYTLRDPIEVITRYFQKAGYFTCNNAGLTYKKLGTLTPEQARFMASTRPAEEFYDLQQDPFELHNLANDPDHEETVKEHRRKLGQWVKATKDQGQSPEPADALTYWRESSREYFEQGMENRDLPIDISDKDYLRWWETKLLE
jgi:arylsulfatase A-like enzyme